MYGGAGDGVDYNDVWRYNAVTNNWTWVAGDSMPNSTGNYNQYCEEGGNNTPQSRGLNTSTASIAACSDFWYLFGGGTYTNGLNDLWAFYPATSKWKWLSGSSQPKSLGNYGALGDLLQVTKYLHVTGNANGLMQAAPCGYMAG